MFGSFDVPGARAVDVLNVLADGANQTKWDPLVKSSESLLDWQVNKLQGFTRIYDATPFANRQIHEWQALDKTADGNECWFVTTTRANEELLKVQPPPSSNVVVDDCLAAYRIRNRPEGGVHVDFFSQINAHPFLLTARFVFNIAYDRTVTYVNAVGAKAQEDAKTGRGQQAPLWMFDSDFDGLGAPALVRREFSLSGDTARRLDDKPSTGLDGAPISDCVPSQGLEGLFDVKSLPLDESEHGVALMFWLGICFMVAGLAASLAFGLRRLRHIELDQVDDVESRVLVRDCCLHE
jgi:hypothetical protein